VNFLAEIHGKNDFAKIFKNLTRYRDLKIIFGLYCIIKIIL